MNEVRLEKLYTSRFCGHAVAVEQYLKGQGIETQVISIDSNHEARAEVMRLNDGYASTPTLIFSDGTQMTEPSFGQIRRKLGLESMFSKGVRWVLGLFGR